MEGVSESRVETEDQHYLRTLSRSCWSFFNKTDIQYAFTDSTWDALSKESKKAEPPAVKKKIFVLSRTGACRQTRVIFTRLVKVIPSPRCCLYPLCFLCVCKPSFPPYFVVFFYFTYLQNALAAPTHVACACVLSVGLLHSLWLCVSLSGLSTRQ